MIGFDESIKRMRASVTSMSRVHRLEMENIRREYKAKTEAAVAEAFIKGHERGRREVAAFIADLLRVPTKGQHEPVTAILDRIEATLSERAELPEHRPYSAAVEAAAAVLGVDVRRYAKRSAPVVAVRRAVWQALRDLGYSYPVIARCPVLGTATHKTVMHAIKVVSDMSAKSREGVAFLAATAAARAALISAGIGEQHKETA